MKYLNLHVKKFAFLLISLFAFNSFAGLGTMGQFVTDVQKAARETGRDVDWKTCTDTDRGFNPDHVHKVMEMGNTNSCEYNSKVVKYLKQNVFLIYSAKSKKLYGSGILAADCRSLMTVSHLFKKPKGIPEEEDIVLYNPNSKQRFDINRSSLRMDPQNDDPGKDKAALRLPEQAMCNPKIDISTQDASEIEDKKNASKNQNRMPRFYVLKTNLKNDNPNGNGSESRAPSTRLKDGRLETCSEECTVFNKSNGGLSFSSNSDLLIHDCNTVGGNSGSAIVMETTDGKFSVIGLHGGGHDISGKELHGNNPKDPLNKFTPNKRINYAIPMNEFFK